MTRPSSSSVHQKNVQIDELCIIALLHPNVPWKQYDVIGIKMSVDRLHIRLHKLRRPGRPKILEFRLAISFVPISSDVWLLCISDLWTSSAPMRVTFQH
ncbi:Cytoplasmic dynein 2 intermediate chain [Dirofilaria immitis]